MHSHCHKDRLRILAKSMKTKDRYTISTRNCMIIMHFVCGMVLTPFACNGGCTAWIASHLVSLSLLLLDVNLICVMLENLGLGTIFRMAYKRFRHRRNEINLVPSFTPCRPSAQSLQHRFSLSIWSICFLRCGSSSLLMLWCVTTAWAAVLTGLLYCLQSLDSKEHAKSSKHKYSCLVCSSLLFHGDSSKSFPALFLLTGKGMILLLD